MYTGISDECAQKLKENGRTFSAKLEFASGTADSGIKSITVRQQSTSGTQTVELGGAVAAQLEVEMAKPSLTVAGQEFALSFGLLLDDGTTEYIQIGTFTAQKPTETYDGIIKFTAYDRMYYKLKYGYFTGITSYPADGKKILREVAEMAEITIANLDSLPDGIMVSMRTETSDDGTTQVEPFSGCTYQETVNYLAQMYGCFATFNRDGDLEFRWYTETGYEVSTSRMGTDAECDEGEYELGTIECTAGDETLTVGEGASGIAISNPAMTQEILDTVWERIGGMAYYPACASFMGDPCLDLGDIISISKMDGTAVSIPLMGITQTFDGGLWTEAESYGDTEETESAGSGGSVSAALSSLSSELVTAKEVIASKASIAYLEANYITSEEIEAAYIRTDNLYAAVAEFGYLKATDAEFTSLTADVATIKEAYIDTETVNTLLADYVKASELEADVAEFGYLKATDAEFTTLSADVATIKDAYVDTETVGNLLADYVKASELEADVAEFGYLKATDSVLTNLISQVSVIENAYITTERVNTLFADYVKTDELEADVAEFGYLKTANLDAEAATLGYLKATDADFTTLTADVATIKEAYISTETVGTLFADYVKTDELEADVAEFGYLKTANLDAEAATLGYLKATDADFTTLSADVATIKAAYIDTETVNTLLASYIKTTELEAAVAEFGYVKSTYLNTYYLTAEQIEAAYVTADTLTTSYLDADTIASTYIKADLTNFTTTMMGTLLADAGIVTSMTIQDGYVTGELSSVTINADLITTGTLSVERLLIVGEDGIIYQINAQSGGLTETELTDEVYQNYINGTALVAKSVTADQIAAGTITAAEIAANSITADRMDVSELSSITADVGLLTAGILMSQNYVAGESGIYIDLNAGTIDCEELIVTASERILLTASQTYATLEDYSTLASSLDKAVVSVVAYFAISDSADEYPDFETAEGAASYAGIARAGLWLAGYYGWATEMPVYEDGDYVWLAYLKTYADGSTEWTEPALIVDGSLSEQIVSVKQTTASVQVLADSILQVVTSTNATWYTGDYVIAATSCGTPDEVGCDASLYEGLYYLDQTTGYVYLSDGKTWTYVDALASTTEAMQSMIEVAEGSIKSELTSYATITYADGKASDAQSAAQTYADSAASEAESNANKYTDGQLSYYSTTETMTNAITQAITDSENSITSAISTTYATISYTDGKASDAQSAAQTYADSAAGEAESNANKYTDGQLSYYSTTETMTNAITQAITDSENSITSAISTTYATISYTDGKASDAQSAAQTYADSAASEAESNANEYTDGKLSYYSTTETMTNAITQAIKDGTNAIMLDVSNTYATTEYAQDAADDALEAAKSYTSSTISASLALKILEAEDGTKYGAISANADYILLSGSQIEIVTDDFTLSNGSAAFSGELVAASGSFAGELVAASGSFAGEVQAVDGTFGTITGGILMSENYVSGESGIYIDLNEGTIDCASLTASISDGLLLTVSQTYATLEDYSTLASSLDKAVVSVVAYFAISDSADEYPDFEAAEGAASYAGIARAGLWLAGYYGWATEMPVYEDGDYVWLAYLKTYADGSTEWTEPALIVDGSLSEQIVSVKQTTASVQVLADSILQVVTSTNATWYTGDYVIAVTSCGTPDEVGCDASLYEGLCYLDQMTGYVYLSDGKSWEKAAELESTISTMQTLVENTESSIKSTVSSWVGAVTVYYGTCSSDAGYPYKTVECGSFDADSLVAGASIRITFANGNKAYPLLLNINGTGSVPAYVDGANFNADSDTWDKNATAVFEYDGTVWNLVETGSYAYAQTLVEQTAETWSATLTENYATKASLALTLTEGTDEEGNIYTYGTISAYATCIKLAGNEIEIETDDFTLARGSASFAGTLTAASGTFGTITGGILMSENYVSGESGIYIDLDNGIIDCVSLVLSASDNVLSEVSKSYATITYTNSAASDAQSAAQTYADSAASGAQSAAESYAQSAADEAESSANNYTDGRLSYYSTTETMTSAISQSITDSTSSIMLEVSKTYTLNTTAVYYGTCSSTAGIPYKTIKCDDFDADSLATGASIRVTFTYGCNCYPLQLNINSTGNIDVYLNGEAMSASSHATWESGETVVFIYDGSHWNVALADTAVQASLALEIATDDDGKSYGTLSANADYIKFEAKEFIVDAGNFSIDADSVVKAGGFTIGESALYTDGHDAYNSTADGVYVGLDYISVGKEGKTHFKSDGTAQIGSWTFDTYQRIYYGTTSMESDTDGIYIAGNKSYNDVGIRMVDGDLGTAVLTPEILKITNANTVEASITIGYPYMYWNGTALSFGYTDTTLAATDWQTASINFDGTASFNDIEVTGSGTSTFWSDLTVLGQLQANSIIETSDARLKTDFGNVEDYDGVFDSLKPLTFRYKKGSGVNIGFTYQDTIAALEAAGMDPADSGLVSTYADRESGEEYGAISYTEFVALLVAQVQALKLRVTELESQRATA